MAEIVQIMVIVNFFVSYFVHKQYIVKFVFMSQNIAVFVKYWFLFLTFCHWMIDTVHAWLYMCNIWEEFHHVYI